MMHLVVLHKEFCVPGQIKGSRQYDNTLRAVQHREGLSPSDILWCCAHHPVTTSPSREGLEKHAV